MKKGMLTADKTALDATTDIFDLRRFTVRLRKEPKSS